MYNATGIPNANNNQKRETFPLGAFRGDGGINRCRPCEPKGEKHQSFKYAHNKRSSNIVLCTNFCSPILGLGDIVLLQDEAYTCRSSKGTITQHIFSVFIHERETYPK